MAVGGEAAALTRRAKAVCFQGEEHERCERVVELRAVYVGGAHPCLPVERGGRCMSARVQRARLVVVEHSAGLGAGTLRRSADQRRALAAVASARAIGDHQRRRRVGLEAAVEQAQRIGDRARRLVVGDRDRRPHQRQRVGRRVCAAGYGDGAELDAGAAVLHHVTAHQQRHLIGWAKQPIRRPELCIAAGTGADLRPRPTAGSALAYAPAYDRVREPGGDGRGGMRDHAAGGAAAVTDLTEEAQLGDAERARQRVLLGRLHGVLHQPIDVRSGQSGIVKRGADHAQRQAELALRVMLGERSLRDPDDCRRIAQGRVQGFKGPRVQACTRVGALRRWAQSRLYPWPLLAWTLGPLNPWTLPLDPRTLQLRPYSSTQLRSTMRSRSSAGTPWNISSITLREYGQSAP